MKQTLTINLNGIAFHVDDDAYGKLHDYLLQVERRLGKTAETAEIMQDIEARIAELFTDMLTQKRVQVVDMEMAEQVMAQLGSPEAFGEEEVADTVETDKGREVRKRRFYRDVDNQILGGVCAGIAAYLGWDAFWVRILVLACTCFWGITIPVYLIVWAIAPAALTAAQRLEMRGEIASVENIKREYEQAKEYAERHNFSRGCRRVFEVMFKLFLGFLLVFVGGPLLIVLGALCVAFFGVAFGLLGGAGGWLAGLPFVGVLDMFGGNGWLLTLFIFFVVLLIGIPLFAVIYWIVKYARRRQHPSASFWWITGVMWIVSLLGAGAMAVWTTGTLAFADTWFSGIVNDEAETRDVEAFHSVVAAGAVSLDIRQDANRLLVVRAGTPSNISTEVRDSVLYIGLLTGGLEGAEITLSLPQLRAVSATGACRIKTDGTFSGDSLSLVLSGASEADLDMDYACLAIDAQGASRLKMQGTAHKMDLRLAGAGEIEAYGLLTDTATVWCAGGSKAEVVCAESLDAQAYGASKITYKGNPAIERNVSVGASKIRRK